MLRQLSRPLMSTLGVKQFSRNVSSSSVKRVVIFGAGRMAKPVLKLLDTHDDVHITVASDNEAQGQELLKCVSGNGSKASFRKFRIPEDMNLLPSLMGDNDLAISLLPATMHLPIAEEAINQKKHLVTASYVSPGMRALHDKAKAAGVALFNEVGLDPGIDHMLVMKAVDSIHARGGKVEELISLCGGLPDPCAADNPFMYKMSWSPRGVLMAAKNEALYLKNGETVHVPLGRLLYSAEPMDCFPVMSMEVLPNRNSIDYKEFYGVPDVHTIYRGTLRYKGWANVMQAFHMLGFLENTESSKTSWHSFLEEKVKCPNASTSQLITATATFLQRSGMDARHVPAAIHALEWVGILGEGPAEYVAKNPFDSLCDLLEKRLQYKEGERDMVAMYHTIVGRMPDGSLERHTSKLLDYGESLEDGDSSMSKTVGYTTGAAAELILWGGLKETGVIIPTQANTYLPILDRLRDFGITWIESVVWK